MWIHLTNAKQQNVCVVEHMDLLILLFIITVFQGNVKREAEILKYIFAKMTFLFLLQFQHRRITGSFRFPSMSSQNLVYFVSVV